MADFDWVKARAACSLEVLFQQLRVAVKRDVDSMNAVLAQAGRPVQCQFGDFSNRFLVMISGNGFPMRRAEFALSPSGISVEVDKPKQKTFSAIATLNPDGDCRLVVNNQELELWQVCRLGLEDLFFGG
ncbi:MAG: hypothetical protein ABSF25_02075 [Bryobacteraceae bacterium]|jgi:hypothetical protein